MIILKKEVYPIKEILSRISKDYLIFNGDFVYMGDKKYEVISYQGTKCINCENKGSYFIKEVISKKNIIEFSFGLYGQDRDENEIEFFTEDNRIICQSCKEKIQ